MYWSIRTCTTSKKKRRTEKVYRCSREHKAAVMPQHNQLSAHLKTGYGERKNSLNAGSHDPFATFHPKRGSLN